MPWKVDGEQAAHRSEWKRTEIERRVRREMNRCKHFTGIQNAACKAGINYRALVDGPDFGWAARLPCFKDENSKVVCELLSLPSEEEARRDVEEQEKRIAEFLSQLNNGICPQCKVQVEQRQVGPCVYGTCGHRLYQGTVNPLFAATKSLRTGPTSAPSQ